MKFGKLLKSNLIVSLLFLFSPLYSSEPDPITSFIPDTAIEKLAQEFDREYFPLFLRALDEMRVNDTLLINEYFNRKSRPSDNLLKIPNLDEYEPGFIPVYVFPNDRSIKYDVTFPVIWNDPDYTDPSWNLWYKSLIFLREYLENENQDSIFTAFKIINDYLLSFNVYPEPSCRFIFGDHASAERLKILTQAYLIYNQLNLHQIEFEQKLLNGILHHIFYLVSLEFYSSWANHGILVDESLIQSLSNLKEFKLRDKFIDLAFKRIFEQYRFGYTSEGIHKEHSPCYHRNFTLRMNHNLNLAKSLGIVIPQEIINIQEKANNYLRYIRTDEFSIPIGSCRGIFRPVRRTQFNNHNTFKHGYRVFPLSGWAFIRDSISSVSIFTQSSFHSFSHYHQDETSFILNIGGYDLIIDPGIFSFDRSSPYYHYQDKARAHNVLLVNDRDFNSDRKNFGLAGITRHYPEKIFDSINCNIAIETTHPHYNDFGMKVHRQFAYPESNKIVIKDIVTSDSVFRCTQLFHLAEGARVSESNRGLYITWDFHPYGIFISNKKSSYKIIEGQLEPVHGWFFQGWNVAKPSPVLIFEQDICSGVMETTLRIFNSENRKIKIHKGGRKAHNLLRGLEKTERRELKHQPLPMKWRPERVN